VAAISVGSVEVDVVPNTRGIRSRLQADLVPAGNQIGDELGRILGRHISTQVAQAIRNGVTTGGRTATPAAARSGEQAGGAFGRTFRTRVQAAMQNLPRVDVRIDETGFNADMARLRARLETLSNKRIGVDVDAATALAEIERLQADLRRLGANHPDVNVRVDTGQAIAELEALQAEVRRLDGQTARIDIDVNSAAANFRLLTMAAVAFGPAIIPVLPVVAAGLGAVAAAASAAAVGFGAVALVAAPAFMQIGKTLQAQKAAQDAATDATLRGGQAAAQASSRALQLASAQAAVASAERNGARQIAQAQQQVTQARRNAAQVAAQASLRTQQAARAVEDAEEALADAQRDARRAQEDLTAARRTAAQELEDLNNRLAGSVLSQREAEIALAEATAERDGVLNNANASDLDRQKALLAYDQAVQRLKEQTTETQRLKQETAAANRAGVDGSETVRTAQERLAEAQEQVADRTQGLRDAQAEQARTATENAQQLAEAQERIADAQRGVAEAQVQAAEQAAAAQRQLEQAQNAATGAVDQAAIAEAKYQQELAKLTPAARETMNAYTGLKDAFGEWSKSLQPAVMPIFTRALEGLTRALPGLTPFVLEAASAIQTLMDKASAELKTPFWREFKEDLQTSVKPAIIGLGVAFGNIFKGMAGIIGAFLPHMDSISQKMQDVTGRFADWGASLKGSPDFERFLAYSAEMAPKIWQALKDIGGALVSIAVAMQPITTVVLGTISALASGIQWVADNAPWVIQGIYGIVVAVTAWRLAMLAWRGAMLLASVAMAAFNLVSMAGPWGWIGLAILGVVALVVFLYTKFEWFRDGVQAVWTAIKTAVVDAWEGHLKPRFQYLWGGIETLGGWFSWLWTEIISPVIGWIVEKFEWLYDVLIGHSILPDIANYITGPFAGVFKWLYDHVIKPVWDGIKGAIKGVWEKGIRPIFNTLKDAVKTVAESFDAARKAIKTAWDKLEGIAKAPVQFIVDVVYNNGIRGVWNKIATAFGAPKLARFSFASGGIMPGYTPGRDVHRFVSPTGGALELSGGEAIMRPEFTRAVGSGFVNTMNAIARSRGAQGIKAALAPVFAGNPPTPTDRSLRYAAGGTYPVQRFAEGGIFGWVKSAGSAVLGAGSAAWNKIKEGAGWLGDTLEASARAGVEKIVNPLLKRFPGMDTGFGAMLRRIPTRIIDALFGYSKEADKRGAGGIGGPRIQKALNWAKTQHGKDYQWGGNGDPSWDCSGFMSAIESVIRGQKPHRRWSTHAFNGGTPPGWVKNGKSAFRVGITHAGVGHTAGTLGKTNVESRGGDGVVVGRRARGYNDRLFTSWYGFMPGKYDSGGYLPPGMNLVYNGTGRPEPVFTASQANALTSLAARGTAGALAKFEGDLYLDSGEFLGRVRGEAQQVMQQGQQELMAVINAI
jgi:hypothetical protein